MKLIAQINYRLMKTPPHHTHNQGDDVCGGAVDPQWDFRTISTYKSYGKEIFSFLPEPS
jgi:hypothetical protein